MTEIDQNIWRLQEEILDKQIEVEYRHAQNYIQLLNSLENSIGPAPKTKKFIKWVRDFKINRLCKKQKKVMELQFAAQAAEERTQLEKSRKDIIKDYID